MNSTNRSTRRLVRTGAIAALLVSILPGLAGATEYTAARKVGRGLAGMTTFFLEIPGNVVETTRERGAGWGFTVGLAVGIGKMIPRVLVGVYETISAPFALPSGFKPILDPEFPWDYFDDPAPARH